MEYILQVNMKFKRILEHSELVGFKELLVHLTKESIKNIDNSLKLLYANYGLNFLSEKYIREILEDAEIVFEDSKWNFESFFQTIVNVPEVAKLEKNYKNKSLQIINNNISWIDKELNFPYEESNLFNSNNFIQLYFDKVKCLNSNNSTLSKYYKNINRIIKKRVDIFTSEPNKIFQVINDFSIEKKLINNEKYLKVDGDTIKDTILWIKINDFPKDIKYIVRDYFSKIRKQDAFKVYLESNYKEVIEQYLSIQNNNLLLNRISDYKITNSKINEGRINRSDNLILKSNIISYVKSVISNASRFIIIASYIIEDNAICDYIIKQKQLKGIDVYVITSFRDDLREQKRSVENNERTYRFSEFDNLKDENYIKLLKAGCNIKHVNSHLKVIVTDNSAMIGSVNLTKGSLYRNLESTIVINNNRDLNMLFSMFKEIWGEYATHILALSSSQKDFNLIETVSSINHKILNYSKGGLFGVKAYYFDLKYEINSYYYDKITIYTGSFTLNHEISKLLQDKCNTVRVYCNKSSYQSTNEDNIFLYHKKYLHAKLVILDSKILYIGGVDFINKPNNNSMIDLMYKITDKYFIQQLTMDFINE